MLVKQYVARDNMNKSGQYMEHTINLGCLYVPRETCKTHAVSMKVT